MKNKLKSDNVAQVEVNDSEIKNKNDSIEIGKVDNCKFPNTRITATESKYLPGSYHNVNYITCLYYYILYF